MDDKQSNYDPKKDLGALVRFLNAILEKLVGMVRHIDSQVNVLIGISLAIFVFSSSRLQNNLLEIHLIILAIASAVSALLGLLAIHPPRFMRKRGQDESLFYNRKISSFPSHREYERQLDEIACNRESMTKEYALEIFNLSRYYYQPKRKLFNLSRNFLLAGISASLVLFILGLFF